MLKWLMIESDEISVGLKEDYSEAYLFNGNIVIKIGLYLKKETNNREMIRCLFTEEVQ